MKEVDFWDLVGFAHYVIALIYILILGFQIRFLIRAFKNVKVFKTFLMAAGVLFSLFIGLMIRAYIFPGGSLNDTRYMGMVYEARIIQEGLEQFKEYCNAYPTTSQGLGALKSMRDGDSCDEIKSYPFNYGFHYTSEGNSYEIKSNREFHVKGLVIYGTDKETAKLYIQE